MNGVNHAATALVINRFWPEVPILHVLISVQIIDILWLVLNIAGVEYTKFESPVRSLADIQFVHMPFSHSVLFALAWAGAAWIVVNKLFQMPSWGLPIAIGVMSHIVLDIATHANDIELIPFLGFFELGTGAYSVPILAFVIEILYCVFCWKVFRGSRSSLAILLATNLAVISLYIPQITCIEVMFSDYPFIFAPLIGGYTLIGSYVVWFVHKRDHKTTNAGS